MGIPAYRAASEVPRRASGRASLRTGRSGTLCPSRRSVSAERAEQAVLGGLEAQPSAAGRGVVPAPELSG